VVYSAHLSGLKAARFIGAVVLGSEFSRTPENRSECFSGACIDARDHLFTQFSFREDDTAECIDFLVNRVGQNVTTRLLKCVDHSMAATGRYQIAYLIGGLQLYALRRELVDSGKMTNARS